MDGRGATGRRRALTLGPVTCLGGGEEGPTVTARVNPRSHVRFLFYDKTDDCLKFFRLCPSSLTLPTIPAYGTYR
ncbi:hypothetical protein IAQ61_009332 [Plenodomus lingam]|uniref:uncharacterized protein n=1 Tax=Leptosphaeria maculans TaxID=5022 RepID=UPI003316E665|nr:hypothetical protein IAQ61_009332 [Plenodomus lingam]